jgi:hypothetical protein
MKHVDTEALLDTLPDADRLRQQLVETLRHANVLRALIRVAEKKPGYRKTKQNDTGNAIAEAQRDLQRPGNPKGGAR